MITHIRWKKKTYGVTICSFDNTRDYKRILIAIDSEKISDEIVKQINSSLRKDIKGLRIKDLIFDAAKQKGTQNLITG